MKRALLLMLCLFALASWSLAADDSLNVRTVGSWPYYSCRTVSTTTIGGHDYAVAGCTGGVFVFNVDTPAAPAKIAELKIPSATAAAPVIYSAIDNGRGYFAAGKTMTIVDLADPANPAIAGEYTFTGPGRIREITIRDTIAFLGCDSSGLRIVNVATPATPLDIGQYCPADVGRLWSVALKDTLGIVSVDAPRQVRVLNMADLSAITEIGHVDYAGGVIRVRGDYTYLGYGSTIGVINIADPANPVWLGSSGGWAGQRMLIVDTLIFCANGLAAPFAINGISDPAHPSLLKNVTTSGYVKDMAVLGHYLFVADDDPGGLLVYDFIDPRNPVMVCQQRPPAIYGKGTISVGTGFFPSDGMHIIDLNASVDPHEIGFYRSTTGGFSKIVLRDSFAFAAEFLMGLRIFNVADPANPAVVDSVKIPGFMGGLAVRDSFVYYAQDTLYVINVAKIDSPYIVSKFKNAASAGDVTIVGNLAYVVAGSAGLRIVDVSDAAHPVELGFYNTPGTATDVAVRDTLAFVADGNSGLRVINVANPATPIETGSWSLGLGSLGGAQAVALDGKLAYVAYDTFGVRVVDISDPAHPVETGQYQYHIWGSGDWATVANGVSIWNSNVYVSYYSHGLQVFHYYGPNGVNGMTNAELRIANTLSPNRPNPFAANTTIHYQLSAASTVTLVVYNVMGQQVRTLASGLQQAGPHDVRWNGRNDAGRQLSAGVYFCRLSANGTVLTNKVVKIK